MSVERSGRRFSWRWLLMLATTGVVLFLLVRHLAGGRPFLDVLVRGRWELVPALLVLLAGMLCVNALRWNLILRLMGYRVPYGRALRVVLATRALDLMAPSRANDLLRPLGIRDYVPLVEGSGSVLAQRAIDVQSLCLLAIAGGVAAGLFEWSAVAAALLALGWATVGLMYWRRRVLVRLPVARRFTDSIRRLAEAFRALARRPAGFAAVAALSLLAWVGALGLVWGLSLVFSADLAPLSIAALWPLAIFVGMLPLTVAGMGTRDAAFLSLLALTGATPVDDARVL
ncbi:MAG: flippase-like domain-containing protein, partial [Deltaproteobacteria bacterium]|nr:flippase-like domain-containing protein [Deltaproteobacteria bacterium]